MKKFAIALTALLILAAASYGAVWLYIYQTFEAEIDRAYARSAEEGYEILGPRPVLTNFPFVPEAYYSGGIRAGDIEFLFPEARLRGYPLPYLPMTLSFPQGIALDGTVDPDTWSLDALVLTVTVPAHFPSELTRQKLARWQQNGGRIEVRSFHLTRDGLAAEGHGNAALDSELQPMLHVNGTIRGHEVFIRFLLENDILASFAAAALNGVMNSFAVTDPQTGEQIVPVEISLENRRLRVGPLQVARLPEIAWDRHTPPARPQ